MDNGVQSLQIPQHISQYALACLTALSSRGLSRTISLGGAFGLAYYYEYRFTHDIDAWWEESTSHEEMQAVVQCLEEALSPFGQMRTRTWGDVYSIELVPACQNRVEFSFQIARRSARLSEPVPAPWPEGTKVDAFQDLVASKMVALVERGAPRDFRDIYTLCHAGLSTITMCWDLWKQRQDLAGSDSDDKRARLAVQTHLMRIATQRPLERIVNLEDRQEAASLREWFHKEFLSDILD